MSAEVPSAYPSTLAAPRRRRPRKIPAPQMPQQISKSFSLHAPRNVLPKISNFKFDLCPELLKPSPQDCQASKTRRKDDDSGFLKSTCRNPKVGAAPLAF